MTRTGKVVVRAVAVLAAVAIGLGAGCAADPDAGAPDGATGLDGSVRDGGPADAGDASPTGDAQVGCVSADGCGAMLLPLYIYPTSGAGGAWQRVIDARAAEPLVRIYAIVNPSSGPGTALDANYVDSIAALQGAGVIALGYIHTDYAVRAAIDCEGEIDRWVAWYGVDGIFFDEMSNTLGDEAYYTALDTYAKNAGLGFTVGNPGTDVPASFVGTVDNIVIYESGGLPAIGDLGGWHDAHPPATWSIIPYATPTLDATFVGDALAHVGLIYVTDDDLPNPWDSLPPYFEALVGALARPVGR